MYIPTSHCKTPITKPNRTTPIPLNLRYLSYSYPPYSPARRRAQPPSPISSRLVSSRIPHNDDGISKTMALGLFRSTLDGSEDDAVVACFVFVGLHGLHRLHREGKGHAYIRDEHHRELDSLCAWRHWGRCEAFVWICMYVHSMCFFAKLFRCHTQYISSTPQT